MCFTDSLKKKTSLSLGFCLNPGTFSFFFPCIFVSLCLTSSCCFHSDPPHTAQHNTTRHDTTLSSFCFVFCAHLDPLLPTVLPSVMPLITGCCAHCFPYGQLQCLNGLLGSVQKVCTHHFIGNGKEVKCGTVFRQKGEQIQHPKMYETYSICESICLRWVMSELKITLQKLFWFRVRYED